MCREMITIGGKLPEAIYRRALKSALYDKKPDLFIYLLPLCKQNQDQLLDYLTVETYAVDWGGVYSKGIEEISRSGHAKNRGYWKDLINPITKQTSLSETLLQNKRPYPSAMDTGKVYYVPEIQVTGAVIKYWVYGIGHRGEILK